MSEHERARALRRAGDLPDGRIPPKIIDYATLASQTLPYNEESSTAASANSINFVDASSPQFIEHAVQRGDSIEGLCMKYKISKATLRQVNDLPSDNIHTVKTLRIPLPGRADIGGVAAPVERAESHASILRRFRIKHGLAEAEARYYLDSANYDEASAAAELKADLAFEASKLLGPGGTSEEAAGLVTGHASGVLFEGGGGEMRHRGR